MKYCNYLTEGMVSDSLKVAADVDVDKIKAEWDEIDSDPNRGNSVLAKGEVLDKEGIGKAAGSVRGTKDRLKKWKVNNKSIIARARKSVLQFPIYTSQSLRVNEAHIISKLFERVYATLVQTVLAQNPIMTEDEANDLVFLQKFHTNLQESAKIFFNEFYDAIDDVDLMLKESVYNTFDISPRLKVSFCATPCPTLLALESKYLSTDFGKGFFFLEAEDTGSVEVTKTGSTTIKDDIIADDEWRRIAIDDLNLSAREIELADSDVKDIQARYPDTVTKSGTTTRGQTDERSSTDGTTNSRGRRAGSTTTHNTGERHTDQTTHTSGSAEERIHSNEFDRAMRERDEINERIKAKEQELRQLAREREKLRQAGRPIPPEMERKLHGISYQNGKYVRKVQTHSQDDVAKTIKKEHIIAAPKMLRDSDIKKINGMLPYTIECEFVVKGTGDRQLDRIIHYVVGVKTIMHAIQPKDLSEDLHELVTGNIKSLQKVRYKTGEIGFWDYVFNVKQIKKDALKNLNGNKRWINTLKRNSEFKKTHGGLLKAPAELLTGKANTPIPNGTMILTQTDVDILKNDTGIDLNLVRNVRKLANSLFLIGFGIVDSAAGTMKVFFPDSDSDWDIQSLSQIDAELSKSDNSKLMSELNKLVNRAS